MKSEVETTRKAPRPGSPADVTLKVNGKNVALGTVPLTVPLLFTANSSGNFQAGVSSRQETTSSH